MAHEEASGEAVDPASERVDPVLGALDRRPVSGSTSLSVTRQRPSRSVNLGDGVVKRVATRIDPVLAGVSTGRRHEPELLHDSPDQAAAAPAVREHGERCSASGHDEEKRLEAGDRALVVERDPPPASSRRQQPRQYSAPSASACGSCTVASLAAVSGPWSSSWCSANRSRSPTVDQSPPAACRAPDTRPRRAGRCPVSPSWTCPRRRAGGSSYDVPARARAARGSAPHRVREGRAGRSRARASPASP